MSEENKKNLNAKGEKAVDAAKKAEKKVTETAKATKKGAETISAVLARFTANMP